jgi:hypothetical protein
METLRLLCRIKPQHIAYLRMTIESYDGMAVVKTVDPRAGAVELRVAPGCEGHIREILDHLSRCEDLPITPMRTVPPDPDP